MLKSINIQLFVEYVKNKENKKLKYFKIMANSIDFSNLTYCGEEAQKIFSYDVYNLDLRRSGITFMDGLKTKMKLYTGELGDVFQAYTCPFEPTDGASLDESTIEAVPIKVNLEECYDQFWNNYLVESTEISLNGGIPAPFSEWFFEKLRQKMSKEYAEIFWKGDTTGTGYLSVIDGIEKQLDDNANVTKIQGSAITIANVVSQVEAAVEAAMAQAATLDVAMDDYKIFMNHSDAAILRVALGKICCTPLNGFGNYGIENGRMTIYGFEVVETVQSRNTIIVAPAKNLVLGFDTYSSSVEYKLIDLRNTTGDNMFRIIAISNIGAGIVFPELAVISKP